MTTAAASNEHGDPLFRNTKNKIVSLSNKNLEMLEQMNKLQHSQLQALTAINNQLDTIPQHVNEQNIDSLVNGLKSRRRLSFQQQPTLSLRPEMSGDGKNIDDVMEVEDINDSRTIDDSFLSLKRSSKILNRNTKDPASSNSAGELDWKYLSAETNSDPENANEMSSNLEDRDSDDLSVRQRRFKNYPTLTINTSANSSRRPITPESSDSEFDISTAHMPLAPTLGGGRNPLRATRHSSAEIYKSDRRPSGMIFNSMDEVIEEERGSLSDIAEHKVVDERSSEDGGKQTVNGRRRTQKYDVGGYDMDNKKSNKIRTQTDESYPVADVQDDNCSVISSESMLDEIGALRSRIKKLESEHASLGDDSMSERKQRRNLNISDSLTSPSAISPSSSQGGSSNASAQRRPSTTAQHNKHLQNAFEFFEKSFATSDRYSNDASPPPSHSMAMVVSSALMLNTKLRGIISQMDDDKPSEKSVKVLLKTSDEQIRSLTECLLALSSLAPKKPSKKIPSERDYVSGRGHTHNPNDPTLLQMPTPTHSTRSVSPVHRIPSAPEVNVAESQNFVDHFVDGPTHRALPIDQQSHYYSQLQRPRYSRVSRPPSPGLPPENINDPQYAQPPLSRVSEYRSRRVSGSAYGGPPGTYQNTSPSPPLPSVLNYDTSNPNGPNGRTYYDRGELSRLQKYSNQSFNNTASPTYQRTTSRPSSYIRTEEPMYPINHARSTSVSSVSSLHRSSSGRSYALRSVNNEFVNSPVSAPRQQSRTYEYTRRYPPDAAQNPIERRQTPMFEMDRRYGRRGGNNLELEGYDLQNGYSEHITERDYIPREEKPGLRRNDSSASTNSLYRQRLVPPLEDQEVQNNVEEGSSEESHSIEGREDDLGNNVGQDLNQVNDTSNNNIENGGYI